MVSLLFHAMDRPPSPPTPPLGEIVEYEKILVTEKIKVTEVRDGRTGALIKRTEEKVGETRENLGRVLKGQRPGVPCIVSMKKNIHSSVQFQSIV